MKSFFTLLIIALAVAGCKPETREHVAEKWPNGQARLVYTMEIQDGKEAKVFEKQFHENGQLLLEGELVDDKRNGVWRSFYDNGNKWSQHSFIDGEKHGASSNWYENGNLRFKGLNDRGTPIGTWLFYSEDGKLANEKNYDS